MKRNPDKSIAWNEGYSDYCKGINENPFSPESFFYVGDPDAVPDTQAITDWENGYRAGQVEDELDEIEYRSRRQSEYDSGNDD